jgi:hypothetical protein
MKERWEAAMFPAFGAFLVLFAAFALTGAFWLLYLSFASIIVYCFYVFLYGLLRTRFSLRSLMIFVFIGGIFGTLISKREYPTLQSLGILGMLVLVSFVAALSSMARADESDKGQGGK